MRTHAQKYAEIERWRFALLAKLEAEQAIDSSPPPPPATPETRAQARLLARAIRSDGKRRDYYEHCKRQRHIRQNRTAA